jgi:hypothetical protein
MIREIRAISRQEDWPQSRRSQKSKRRNKEVMKERQANFCDFAARLLVSQILRRSPANPRPVRAVRGYAYSANHAHPQSADKHNPPAKRADIHESAPNKQNAQSVINENPRNQRTTITR